MGDNSVLVKWVSNEFIRPERAKHFLHRWSRSNQMNGFERGITMPILFAFRSGLEPNVELQRFA